MSNMERLFPKASLVQEVGPPGGYPDLDLPRLRWRPRMPPGIVLWGAVLGTMTIGWIKLHYAQLNRVQEFAELRTARLNLIPLLQAEDDRRYLRDRRRQLEEEAYLMKDVPGWIVGEPIYKTRWMPPTQPVYLNSK